MILDTQFLGELVEQNPNARTKAAELDAADVVVRIPSLVVWEIFYGVSKAPPGKEEPLREAYEQLFEVKPVVDLDEELARDAGELRGRHSKSDDLRTLDGADSAVAATALHYDEPVVSNDSDFQDVDGLSVETY